MSLESDTPLDGILHVYVAFDCGDEVELDAARKLVPANLLALPRRRRTPTSIAYRPPPLRLTMGGTGFNWPELGQVDMATDVTVFDFAAVSIAFHVPFHLPKAGLSRLGGW